MREKVDVSIIIVNYNTKILLDECLKSIYEYTKNLNFEILVSDNGSSDGSVKLIKTLYSQVILIENNDNIGFGAANNRALAKAVGKYVFYLNSDTVLLNNAVKFFFDYFEEHSDESIGALGCMLLNKEGNIIHSGGKFPSYLHSFLSLYNCLAKQICCYKGREVTLKSLDKSCVDVDYVIGADLFVLNNKEAAFDERFFMYSEEVDLQYQLSKGNLRRCLITGPEIIHLCGGSETVKTVNYDFRKITQFYYWSSLLKYFKKNMYKPLQFYILKKSVIFAFSVPWNIKVTRKFLRELKTC